jgi:inosose dehydratase
MCKLLDAAGAELIPFLALGGFAGFRTAEIGRLDWSAVDFERHVITTEGEPATEFGESLTDAEKIFSIREKLHEPLRLAEDLGVKLLLEPHGPVTDHIALTERLLDACNSDALALNLDTGNLWLGGGDPVAYVRKFGSKIEHVHWKDMPAEMEPRRGKVFGCGMATIALGAGVVGIAEVVKELHQAGFSGHTTLEIAGEAAVLASRDFLLRTTEAL